LYNRDKNPKICKEGLGKKTRGILKTTDEQCRIKNKHIPKGILERYFHSCCLR